MTNRKEQSIKEELAEMTYPLFRNNNFSHNSAEEFLRLKGESYESYAPIHLSVAYVKANNEDERILQTELKLAKEAIKQRCRYVTNIDYCVPCIAATGLRRIM